MFTSILLALLVIAPTIISQIIYERFIPSTFTAFSYYEKSKYFYLPIGFLLTILLLSLLSKFGIDDNFLKFFIGSSDNNVIAAVELFFKNNFSYLIIYYVLFLASVLLYVCIIIGWHKFKIENFLEGKSLLTSLRHVDEIVLIIESIKSKSKVSDDIDFLVDIFTNTGKIYDGKLMPYRVGKGGELFSVTLKDYSRYASINKGSTSKGFKKYQIGGQYLHLLASDISNINFVAFTLKSSDSSSTFEVNLTGLSLDELKNAVK